jgi:hypothetical protein
MRLLAETLVFLFLLDGKCNSCTKRLVVLILLGAEHFEEGDANTVCDVELCLAM